MVRLAVSGIFALCLSSLLSLSCSLQLSIQDLNAKRFVISAPANGSVGNQVKISVKAVDEAGEIDTTFNAAVELHTSGSATGAGTVNIVNGLRHKIINH